VTIVAAGLGVSSQTLMGHSYRVIRRMRYGTDSTRERHNDRSKPGPPMSLANMRANGVREVSATCEACGHQADVNVEALPESVHVPQVSRRMHPVWREADQHETGMAHRPTPRRSRLSAA
jgi:hypothetical protein